MVSRIILLAMLALAATAPAEFNFVPVNSFYETDGVRIPNLAFHDGRCRVTYMPPARWTYTGNFAQLTLYPPNIPRADATVTATDTPTPTPLSSATTTYYESVARTLLPRDTTAVELHEMIFDPLRICGHPTVEFIFDFVVFSQRYRLSCLLLPREHDRLQFILCSPPEHFETLRREFQRSLYSLEGL